MDIRPVDVQMFINKSSQVNRSENQDQRLMEQNLLFSEQVKKDFEQENQRTIETSKSEDSQVNKDGNGKNKYKGQKGKEKKSEKNSNNKNTSSFLDISI